MSLHEFAAQFHRGLSGEQRLDTHFAATFNIVPATRDQQRQGIDRIFTSADGTRITVEYKTDYYAGTSGNVFVEVVSVDRAGKPGWIWSCQSDFLIVYVPGWRQAFITQPCNLRRHMDDWYAKFPCKASPNLDYHTIGVCVPRLIFAAAAYKVVTVEAQ